MCVGEEIVVDAAQEWSPDMTLFLLSPSAGSLTQTLLVPIFPFPPGPLRCSVVLYPLLNLDGWSYYKLIDDKAFSFSCLAIGGEELAQKNPLAGWLIMWHVIDVLCFLCCVSVWLVSLWNILLTGSPDSVVFHLSLQSVWCFTSFHILSSLLLHACWSADILDKNLLFFSPLCLPAAPPYLSISSAEILFYSSATAWQCHAQEVDRNSFFDLIACCD
jgi:hypothetical protein